MGKMRVRGKKGKQNNRWERKRKIEMGIKKKVGREEGFSDLNFNSGVHTYYIMISPGVMILFGFFVWKI